MKEQIVVIIRWPCHPVLGPPTRALPSTQATVPLLGPEFVLLPWIPESPGTLGAKE